MSRHKRNFFKLNSLFLWHRYLGLLAAFFVLVLATTGLMLNHSSGLQLVNKPVTSNWLLDWYGIKTPSDIKVYSTENQWVSQWGQQIYLDSEKVGSFDSSLTGVADLGHMLVIATTNRLILLTHDGEVIEIMDSNNGTPAGIKQIGRSSSGSLIINAAHGYYRADEQLLSWKHIDSPALFSAPADRLPAHLADKIQNRFRQHSINYERILLDIHSGRFVGEWGIYIMDGAAIILILLSLSGSSLWVIRIFRKRTHIKPHQK